MNTQTQATLEAQIAQLRAENEKLKAAKSVPITLKVSKAGALSLYGMGRFPVTLYKSQWQKVIALVPQIEAFIKANDSSLKEKE